MATSFTIQHARTTAELEAAADLFRAYAGSLGIDLAYQAFEAELASLPGKYAEPEGVILLATDTGGEAIGCVALRPLAQSGVCEMKRLYVAPAGRGCGLGRSLVDALIREAVERGYDVMVLDTLPTMTAAIDLYRNAGFRPTAPYYDTPVVGTLFLARPLVPKP